MIHTQTNTDNNKTEINFGVDAPKVTYLHLRSFGSTDLFRSDGYDKLMSVGEAKYHSFWPNRPNNTGGATIAIVEWVDSDTGEKSINIGIAICSRNDQFKKATGRDIALSRALKARDENRVLIMPKFLYRAVHPELISQIMGRIPQWAYQEFLTSLS